MTNTDTASRILDNAAAVKQAAQSIDTSRTQTVPMSDLRVGDVVLSVGPNEALTFPFPFTLSKVSALGKYGVVMLQATHGWFSSPYPSSDPAVIVAR